MAIINSAMQPTAQPAMQPGIQPGGAQPSPPRNQQAEAMIKKIGQNAMKVIFGQPSDDIVAQLKTGSKNQAQAIAQVTLQVLNKLKRDIQGVNPEVVFSIHMSVIVWIMELGAAAGVLQPSMELLKASLAELASAKKVEQQPQQPQQQTTGAPAGMPAAMLAQPMGA